MKQSDQKNLLLAQDVDNELRILLKKPNLLEAYAEDKKLRAKGEELKTAFEKEREKQKDYIKAEINGQYDQEAKALTSYKIINNGLALKKPALEYNEVFSMDNFVKKVGNNYLFNIGNIIGSYKKLD